MSQATDNEIMFRVRDGRLDQMGILFDRHHKPLYGFFYHNTGLKQQSEDLVQTVFMNMIRSRSTFTGSHKFVTWMYVIARNALSDYYRLQQRKGIYVDAAGHLDEVADEAPADARIQLKEEQLLVREALSRLEAADREVLILARYQELKYQEIARMVNSSEGAVKVRIHRAMKQLKQHYLALSQQKQPL